LLWHVTPKARLPDAGLADHVVIVGGGYIGFQTAQVLKRLNMHICLNRTPIIEFCPKLRGAEQQFDLQWIRLAPESPIVYRSIGENEIRKKTGGSVVGVVGEGQLRPNPDAEFVLMPNDLIAIIGSESDRETFCLLASSTACYEALPRT
jgi:Trk K+ transport system NAD-binding subunit